MRKLITIFFLLIYLFSTSEAHELLKLPVVFQHFAEHKAEDATISFLQFLDIHYMHGSPKDADYDRDMQLPFKTTGEFFASSVAAYIPITTTILIHYPVEEVSPNHYLQNSSFLLPTYLSNIWQPPKYC